MMKYLLKVKFMCSKEKVDSIVFSEEYLKFVLASQVFIHTLQFQLERNEISASMTS